ncbi:lipocalin-like domain-containing protein [Bradyrhizobium liaoningense]
MITRTQLVGAWSLESYMETDVQSGEVSYPMGRHPEGLILYTFDGYMSAQLGSGGRERFKSQDPYGASSEEYTAAGRSYIAYSGPFYFDESNGRLEHEMFVSFFPNWQGQRQVRIAAIDDDRLHLGPDHPMPFNGRLKTASLIWKRTLPNF